MVCVLKPARDARAAFPPAQVAEVKALACELPAQSGVPLSRWSTAELAAEATIRGIMADVSRSSVWRWLNTDAIKPWFHRSWIFPRDPAFAVKAARVLGLYERCFDGEALRDNEFVISADEKPSIQAR